MEFDAQEPRDIYILEFYIIFARSMVVSVSSSCLIALPSWIYSVSDIETTNPKLLTILFDFGSEKKPWTTWEFCIC